MLGLLNSTLFWADLHSRGQSYNRSSLQALQHGKVLLDIMDKLKNGCAVILIYILVQISNFFSSRNLICVYSKKHLLDVPELIEMKRKSNTRSLKEMALLLRYFLSLMSLWSLWWLIFLCRYYHLKMFSSFMN